MILSGCCSSSFSVLSKNSKVVALESNLQQCVLDFRELITDLESLQIESENTKSQYITLKEKCDSKTCSGAEQLHKEVTKRDEIIQSVASLLTKLYETRDMNIINIAFKVLCQDSSPLTPPEEKEPKDSNALKGSKDPNSSNDPKVSKDSKASKSPRDSYSSNNPKVSKDSKASKSPRDSYSSNNPKVSKDSKASKSPRDSYSSNNPKDSKASKSPRDSYSSNNPKVSKDSKASKSPRDSYSSNNPKVSKDETKDLNASKVSYAFNAPKDSKDTSTDSRASKDTKDSIALKPSPKEQNTSITENVSFKEESLCEIEGTPTGRLSPIIQSKKIKNNLGKSSDFREKKKLPEEWSTEQPNSKSIKLTYTTPRGSKGKLKQSKISLVKVKPSMVVDLTSSPELGKVKQEYPVKALVKKESMENDDTILPSPTSGPSNFDFKESPAKWKKPAFLVKTEKVSPKRDENLDIKAMEESINILNRIPDRLKTNIKTETPTYTEPMDADATRCDTEFSVSLLDRVNKLEKQCLNGHQISPLKRPLHENINVVNTPPKQDPDSSVSLLRPIDKPNAENVKRKIELIEPMYKEPAVRKKAEKRALQGWSCDECRNFYGALYKDDPVMLSRKIEECSKHRGRHNPVRPKTPDGYWNPRWEVPQDTDELNRMNDAL